MTPDKITTLNSLLQKFGLPSIDPNKGITGTDVQNIFKGLQQKGFDVSKYFQPGVLNPVDRAVKDPNVNPVQTTPIPGGVQEVKQSPTSQISGGFENPVNVKSLYETGLSFNNPSKETVDKLIDQGISTIGLLKSEHEKTKPKGYNDWMNTPSSGATFAPGTNMVPQGNYLYGTDIENYRDQAIQLDLAQDLLSKAKKWSRAPKESKQVGASLWSALKDYDYMKILTAGFSNLAKEIPVAQIANKSREGKPLTEFEQQVLNAQYVLNLAQNVNDPSVLYKATNTALESIPFLIQMAYTGGVSAGVKGAVTKGIEKLSGGAAEKFMGKSLQKLPGSILGNASRLPFVPMTYENYAQGLSQVQPDNNGRIIASPVDSKLSLAKQAVINSFGEYFFEESGDWMQAGIKSLGKAIGTKQGAGVMADVYKKVKAATHYNGPLFEIAEEELNGLYNVATDPNTSWKDFANKKNQIDIIAGTLMMSMGFGMLEAPGRFQAWKVKKDYDSAKNIYEQTVPSDIRSQVDPILNTDEGIKTQWENLKNLNIDLSGDHVGALFDYITAKQRYEFIKSADHSIQSEAKFDNAQELKTNADNNVDATAGRFVGKDGNITLAQDDLGEQWYIKDDAGDGISVIAVKKDDPETIKFIPKQTVKIINQIPYEQFKANASAEILKMNGVDAVADGGQVAVVPPAETDYRAGDTFTHNGSEYVISQIENDGSVLADPVSGEGQAQTFSPQDMNTIWEYKNQESQQAPSISEQESQKSRTIEFNDGKNTVQFGIKENPDGTKEIDHIFNSQKEVNRVLNELSDQFPRAKFEAVDISDQTDEFAPAQFVIRTIPNENKQTVAQETPQGGTQQLDQAQENVAQTQPAEQAPQETSQIKQEEPINDNQNITGIPGEVQQGTQPVETKPDQGTGGEKIKNYRIFQTSPTEQVAYNENRFDDETNRKLSELENAYVSTPYKPANLDFGSNDEGKTYAIATSENIHHNILAEYIKTALNGLGYNNVSTEKAKSGSIYIRPYGPGSFETIRISDHLGRGGVFEATYSISNLKDAKNLIRQFKTHQEREVEYKINSEKDADSLRIRKRIDEELESTNKGYGVIEKTYQDANEFKNGKSIYAIKTTELGENSNGKMAYKHEFITDRNPYSQLPPIDTFTWFKPDIFSKNKEISQEESRVNTEPTEGQKKAGNYKKGHISVQGMEITIENPKGSVRKGTDRTGRKWEQVMNNTYGYFKGTKGKDKDHIDVFLGDNLESDKVYVIDQIDPETGEFDENKVMLGFNSESQAKAAYLSNYEPGWQGMGAITEMPVDKFKDWKQVEHRTPVAYDKAEYLKSKKKESGDRTNFILDQIKQYNQIPANQIRKRADQFRVISRGAQELGLQLSTEDKKLKLMRDGKSVGYSGSRTRIDAAKEHKTLSEYSPEFQDFFGKISKNADITILLPGTSIGMSTKEKEKGLSDIENGKQTVPAATLLDELEKIHSAGGMDIIHQGQRVFVPIEEMTLDEQDLADADIESFDLAEKALNENDYDLLNTLFAEHLQNDVNLPTTTDIQNDLTTAEGSASENSNEAGTAVNNAEGTNPETSVSPDRANVQEISETQRAELDRKLKEIDYVISDLEKRRSSLQQSRDKKLAELNDRNGLFGDTTQPENDLSAGTFQPTNENIKKALEPIDADILSVEKEIEKQKILRERVIQDAGKQTELSIQGMTENVKTEDVKTEDVKTETVISKPDFSSDISYERAKNAYRAISFDPEKRGRSEVNYYIKFMNDVWDELYPIANSSEQKKTFVSEFEKFRKGMIDKTNAYLDAKSRTMSSMITGPARFPVERNQKRMDTEHKRSVELTEYETKGQERIKKAILDKRTPEEKADEVWNSIQKTIDDKIRTIIAIDKGEEKGLARQLFVSSLTGFIKRMYNNGQYDHVIKAIDHIRDAQSKLEKPILADKNSIWKLKENSVSKLEEIQNQKTPENPTGVELIYSEGRHTKTNDVLHIVKSSGKVDRNVFQELNNKAKSLGGYYSSFVKGFIFKTKDSADEFMSTRTKEEVLLKRESSIKDTFYSNTENALDQIKQEKATPEQWKAMLLKNGAKKDEMDWMGMDRFLEGGKTITKSELRDFISQNSVRMEEVVKESKKNEIDALNKELSKAEEEYNKLDFKNLKLSEIMATPEARKVAEIKEKIQKAENNQITKYGTYATPGGKNYKEWLLTMPGDIPEMSDEDFYNQIWKKDYNTNAPEWNELTEEEKQALGIEKKNVLEMRHRNNEQFTSGHWSEPNILVHARTQEFTDKDGKKVLLIDEIQSDWAQKGRREGFEGETTYSVFSDGQEVNLLQFKTKDEAEQWAKDLPRSYTNIEIRPNDKFKSEVPNMPFKSTDQWSMLAFKRLLRYAAENDFDKIAWTTGEQQAERYDLSKQIDRVEYWKSHIDGRYGVAVWKDNDIVWSNPTATPEVLNNTIGKELADKIIKDADKETKTYSGLDLKIGGEGMKGFYDQILPSVVNKYVKKWNSKVGETELITEKGNKVEGTTDVTEKFHSIDITQEMKESVLQGQPMFKNESNPMRSGTPLPDHSERLKEFDDMVREAIAGLEKRFGEKVDIVYDPDGLPERIKRQINFKDTSRTPGIFDPTTGKIYLVLNQVNDVNDAVRTVLHEVTAHKGLRKILGKDFDQILKSVYNGMSDREIKIMSDSYGTDPFLIAEEYMATLSETFNVKPTWMQRIVSEIKFLVAKHFGIKLNEKDIYTLIWKSRQALEREAGFQGKDVAMKLLHGSAHEINGGFHSKYMGTGEGNQLYGWGFYFTDQKAVARYFAAAYAEFKDYLKTATEKIGDKSSKMIEKEMFYLNEALIKAEENGQNVDKEFESEYNDILAERLEAKAEKYDPRPEIKDRILAAAKYVRENPLPKERNIYQISVSGKSPYNMNWLEWDTNMPTSQRLILNRALERSKLYSARLGRITRSERITGQDIYEELFSLLGSAREASMFLRNAGFDGISYPNNFNSKGTSRITAKGLNYVVFDGSQLDIDKRVRFRNVDGGTPAAPLDQFNEIRPPKKILNTWTEKAREKLQDSMLAWKKVLDNEGLKFKDHSNVYLVDNQKNSRAQARVEKFYDELFLPVLKNITELEKLGKTSDVSAYAKIDKDLEEKNITEPEHKKLKDDLDKNNIVRYLIAKHAPERNRTIYQENAISKIQSNKDYTPEQRQSLIDQIKQTPTPEGISFAGMTDQEADDIVRNFEKGIPQETINKLWNDMRKASDDVMKMWVEYGRFDKATYDKNNERGWKYYVPLRGWEKTAEDIDFDYNRESGQGNFSGVNAMKGRKSIADDPVAYLYQNAMSAVKWGEKNRVKQALVRLIRENSDRTDLFYLKKVFYLKDLDGNYQEVIKEGDNLYTIDGFNEDGTMQKSLIGDEEKLKQEGMEILSRLNTEHQKRKPRHLFSQHELETYINGEKFIAITRDPKLANEINKSEALGTVPGFFQINRIVSHLRTGKNPAWIIKNQLRDFHGALNNTWIEQDAKTTAKFVETYWKATKYLLKGLNGPERAKYQKYWKEFVAGGGRTGTTNLQDIEVVKKNIRKEIENLKRSQLSKFTGTYGERIVGSAFGLIDTLAQYTENLTRFAAYVTAKESGKSHLQSINAAKEISVNFDRKGLWTSTIGSFIAFFNASIQGAQKQFALAYHHPARYTVMAAQLAALGFIQSVLYSMLWDDDDKKKDYKTQNKYNRYNNLIIGMKDHTIMIPLAQGYRMFNSFGVIAHDLISGKIDAETATYDLADQMNQALSPVDVSNIIQKDKAFNPIDLLKFVTLTEPIINVQENKDYRGAPIYREPFTKEKEKYTPKIQQHLRNVNPLLEALTDGIYKYIGKGDPTLGTNVKADNTQVNPRFDINPSVIEYYIKTYTAGPGTFILDAITSLGEAIQSDEKKAAKEKEFGDATKGFDLNTLPVMSSFIRSKYQGFANEEYRKLTNWKDNFESRLSTVKNGKKYDLLFDEYSNPDYAKYVEINNYDKIINNLYEYKKLIDDPASKESIDNQIFDIKRSITSKYEDLIKFK